MRLKFALSSNSAGVKLGHPLNSNINKTKKRTQRKILSPSNIPYDIF